MSFWNNDRLDFKTIQGVRRSFLLIFIDQHNTDPSNEEEIRATLFGFDNMYVI